MSRFLALLLLVAWPVGLRADEPLLTWRPGQDVIISQLPDLLADEEVRRHLDSGLTTTFSLEARPRGRAQVGGARLEVRFEPWDEVFYVAAAGIDRRVTRRVCRSLEELESWWRELRLPVLLAENDLGPGRVQLRMDVIPFSASERNDTLRWLSDLREAEAEDAPSEAVAEDGAALVSQTVQVLLATSIRRRAIKSFRWEGVLEP